MTSVKKNVVQQVQNGAGRVITDSDIPVSSVQNLDYSLRELTAPEPASMGIIDRVEGVHSKCSYEYKPDNKKVIACHGT